MQSRNRPTVLAAAIIAIIAVAAVPSVAAHAQGRGDGAADEPIPSRPTRTAAEVGIVETTGSHRYLETAPISLRLGELESDTETFLFAERQDIVLEDDLVAEITQPGIWFSDTLPRHQKTPNALPRGAVVAGSKVDSFYGHFDNESYEFGAYKYLRCWGQIGVIGTVTFDRPILAVIINSGTLNASNDDVGVDHTYYDEDEFTRFPGMNVDNGCRSDQVTLSDDRRTLQVRNFTDIHHDNFRIIVAADDTVDVDASLREPDPVPDMLSGRGVEVDDVPTPGT